MGMKLKLHVRRPLRLLEKNFTCLHLELRCPRQLGACLDSSLAACSVSIFLSSEIEVQCVAFSGRPCGEGDGRGLLHELGMLIVLLRILVLQNNTIFSCENIL